MKLDPSNTEVSVRTFVEGALSAMGHDLELRVTRFSIEVDEGRKSVRATFDPASLEVAHALHRGRPAPDALGPKDHRKIQKNVRNDVLHPDRHPEITFTSESVEHEGGLYRVRGRLTLHGRTQPLAFDVRERDGRHETEVTLRQPDFGITPYRAPLGVLKVKPEVTVRVVRR
jgi:polyisoprenoid-binding protein YceI